MIYEQYSSKCVTHSTHIIAQVFMEYLSSEKPSTSTDSLCLKYHTRKGNNIFHDCKPDQHYYSIIELIQRWTEDNWLVCGKSDCLKDTYLLLLMINCTVDIQNYFRDGSINFHPFPTPNSQAICHYIFVEEPVTIKQTEMP